MEEHEKSMLRFAIEGRDAVPADAKATAKIWNDAMADVIAESRNAGAERRLALARSAG
jgi:hypothetical protein